MDKVKNRGANEKVRVSAVSYINTIPFIYGIENNSQLQIELSKDIPSECARKLMEGEVDVGLVPVAIIPLLKKAAIISEYCIGAEGKVDTVLLLSDVSIEKIEKIVLDYQSRTSVALCKVLCKHYWNIQPTFVASQAGFETEISGTTAGVIIGDRTFDLPKDFLYKYDLAEEWYKMTQLPFVFAAWVSTKELTEEFIALFNSAMKFGINNISSAVEIDNNKLISKSEKIDYLQNSISYTLNQEKKEALDLFHTYLKDI